MKECKYCKKEVKRPISVFCSTKCKSLFYYYSHKDEILKYQIARIEKKRKEDPEFHNKYNIRKYSEHTISLEGKQCEKCGSVEDLHRHHKDYSKPLEVTILCRNCHNEEHK